MGKSTYCNIYTLFIPLFFFLMCVSTQLDKTEKIMYNIIGYSVKYFRLLRKLYRKTEIMSIGFMKRILICKKFTNRGVEICMSYVNYEKLLNLKQITSYQVSKATGIAPSTLTDWKRGRSVPKADKMKLIAEYLGVGIEQLIGEEDITFSDFEIVGEIRNQKRIPIIGEIRAGRPIITNETLLGYEYADIASGEDVEDFFYLRVCGDSMKDCGMINGSLVLFRKQQYAKENDIVACLVGGDSATVKRFHRQNRKIYLLPENDAYEPIELTTDDFESGMARILGVAVEMKIKF